MRSVRRWPRKGATSFRQGATKMTVSHKTQNKQRVKINKGSANHVGKSHVGNCEKCKNVKRLVEDSTLPVHLVFVRCAVWVRGSIPPGASHR